MPLAASLEDNVLTAICWSETLAPQIAAKVTVADFSTATYRKIAETALDFLQRHHRPGRVHIRDRLEDDIRRGSDGKFMDEILDEMEQRLAGELNEEFVLQELDRFLQIQRLHAAVNEISDFLTEGNLDEARRCWASVNVELPAEDLFDPWVGLQAPPLDLDMLPRELHEVKNFVRERSEKTGLDRTGFFWGAMSTASAAIDASRRLQINEDDPYHTVPPGIWSMLIGRSSTTAKSGIFRAVLAPLEMVQNEEFARNEKRVKDWERNQEEKTPKPKATRYIAQGASPEALQLILTGQDRGVMMANDELVGTIGMMYAYSGDSGLSARAFMLQSYDGGPYTIDRVGSGGREKGGYVGRIKENHVVHSGGVQPSKLRKLIDKLDLTDDGYLQRFIPIILQPRQKGRRGPIGREVAVYEELIKHLAQVPGGAVDEATGLRRRHIVRLSSDAQRIAERVDDRVLQLSKNDYLGDAYSSHVGRLTRMWGSLVLTLGHILKPRCDFIDAGPAELAETLIFEHVLDHITQFHLWLGSGAGEHMKQIASYILARQPRTNRLLLHHLTNDVRICRGKGVDEIQRMVDPLVAGKWLEPEDGGPGRRAKASWLINPRVYVQFGDDALGRAVVPGMRRASSID